MYRFVNKSSKLDHEYDIKELKVLDTSKFKEFIEWLNEWIDKVESDDLILKIYKSDI